MAGTSNKPFVLLNEEEMCELIDDSDAENTKKLIRFEKPVILLCIENYDVSFLINCFYLKSNSLFWYYIKQIMNVFIRAIVRIFSFGERWNVLFNEAIAEN